MKQFSLEQLATQTGAKLIGDPSHLVNGVDEVKTASQTDVSFVANMKYRQAAQSSNAGLICVDTTFELIEGINFLVCQNPSETFQQIAELMFDPSEGMSAFSGVHPSAVVDPSALIEEGVTIGPNVVIDRNVKIGKKSIIQANVSIGAGVVMGEECLLYPNCVVRERCTLGNRVILQPGAIIGSCGYGYITTEKGEHEKLQQIGNVVLEDDVEIGANTTIDRARFKSTVIGKGTKIDNLVQIGHNVQIGAHNLIVSQTGIAGSSKTGRHVIMGGQVGVVGHVELGDGVMIATRGGVSKSIDKPGAYGGSPVVPMAEYNKRKVLNRKIDSHVKRIQQLENQLAQLTADLT